MAPSDPPNETVSTPAAGPPMPVRPGDEIVRQHERFFLARTSPAGQEIRGVDAMHESDGIAAWRWWSLAELESTSEVVWPAELPALLRSALAGGGSQG
jgi:hypothetical protein